MPFGTPAVAISPRRTEALRPDSNRQALSGGSFPNVVHRSFGAVGCLGIEPKPRAYQARVQRPLDQQPIVGVAGVEPAISCSQGRRLTSKPSPRCCGWSVWAGQPFFCTDKWGRVVFVPGPSSGSLASGYSSALLRGLQRMAASKPTSWRSELLRGGLSPPTWRLPSDGTGPFGCRPSERSVELKRHEREDLNPYTWSWKPES